MCLRYHAVPAKNKTGVTSKTQITATSRGMYAHRTEGIRGHGQPTGCGRLDGHIDAAVRPKHTLKGGGNEPSTTKSCGKSTVRQVESSVLGAHSGILSQGAASNTTTRSRTQRGVQARISGPRDAHSPCHAYTARKLTADTQCMVIGQTHTAER